MPSRSGPPWSSWSRHVWWLVGAVLLVVLMLASSGGVFRGFLPADVSRRTAFVRAALGAAIGAASAWAIRRTLLRRDVPPSGDTMRGVTMMLVALFAITAMTTAPRTTPTGDGGSAPTASTVILPSTPTPDTGPAAQRPVEEAGSSSDDVGSGVMGVVIAFGLAAIIAIMLTYRRMRDDRPGRLAPWVRAPDLPEGEATIDEAAAARTFADSARLLLDDPDPRRAVIAAYAALLDGLAAAGAPREPYEAPEEHLRRALLLLHVPADSSTAVTERFLAARFSRHPVTESHRHAALDALRVAERHLRDRNLTA